MRAMFAKIVFAVVLLTGKSQAFPSLKPCHAEANNTSTRVLQETELEAAREAIADLINEEDCGPLLIRLAWHDAGTYDRRDRTGGPSGCMRFRNSGEARHSTNRGLYEATELLDPIMAEYAPDMSYADFWALAAIVAVREMGGPTIRFRQGRRDCSSPRFSVMTGRLPGGFENADQLRGIFYRMGLDDRDIVVLLGAHSTGRCHFENSGFNGPWTQDPFQFDNAYFINLLEGDFELEVNPNGSEQLRDRNTGTMMLIAEMALRTDPSFRRYTVAYANDERRFFNDFANSFQKLVELGYPGLRDQ